MQKPLKLIHCKPPTSPRYKVPLSDPTHDDRNLNQFFPDSPLQKLPMLKSPSVESSGEDDTQSVGSPRLFRSPNAPKATNEGKVFENLKAIVEPKSATIKLPPMVDGAKSPRYQKRITLKIDTRSNSFQGAISAYNRSPKMEISNSPTSARAKHLQSIQNSIGSIITKCEDTLHDLDNWRKTITNFNTEVGGKLFNKAEIGQKKRLSNFKKEVIISQCQKALGTGSGPKSKFVLNKIQGTIKVVPLRYIHDEKFELNEYYSC